MVLSFNSKQSSRSFYAILNLISPRITYTPDESARNKRSVHCSTSLVDDDGNSYRKQSIFFRSEKPRFIQMSAGKKRLRRFNTVLRLGPNVFLPAVATSVIGGRRDVEKLPSFAHGEVLYTYGLSTITNAIETRPSFFF